LVEKNSDTLRSTYSVQNSSTLNFKSNAMALRELKEASDIGRAVCEKALSQMQAPGVTNYQVTI